MDLICLACALPYRACIPIIILSSSDVEAEALAAGSDLFLNKPAEMPAIVEVVASPLQMGGTP